MQLAEAWLRLGIEPTSDPRKVRRAYILCVRSEHPDVSDAIDANRRTSELGDAYELILEALRTAIDIGSHRSASSAPTQPGAVVPPNRSGPQPGPHEEPIEVSLVADDTIGLAAPPNEAFPFLIEGCHEIGDVTFLDRRAGLVQVTASFIDEPVCYVVMSLQGRATGITEVFCSIESIERRPAPPIAAVTRLLVETLSQLVW